MKKRIIALFLMIILVTVSSVSMASGVVLRSAGKNSVAVSISVKDGKITATAKATINKGSKSTVKVYLQKKDANGEWTITKTGEGKMDARVSMIATSGSYRARATLTVTDCTNGNASTPYKTYDY